MAQGTITNTAASPKVASVLSTNYPIRYESQILSTSEMKSTQDFVASEIGKVISELNSLITACDNAKLYCSTESLSLMDGNGNEINEFPRTLDKLVTSTNDLISKLTKLRDTVNDAISRMPNADVTAYSRWLNSPDNPINQTEQGGE